MSFGGPDPRNRWLRESAESSSKVTSESKIRTLQLHVELVLLLENQWGGEATKKCYMVLLEGSKVRTSFSTAHCSFTALYFTALGLVAYIYTLELTYLGLYKLILTDLSTINWHDSSLQVAKLYELNYTVLN